MALFMRSYQCLYYSHVLFYTGCRVSEALALQPEDIDFKRNEILFYKQTAVKGMSKDFRIETTKTVGYCCETVC